MILPTLDSLRIFLHIIAVAVWVGGQIVLAGIVPALRQSAPGALPLVAKGFSKVAWPAMAIILVTGVWSLGTVNVADQSSEYLVTLAIKVLVVGVAAAATIIHSVGETKLAKALGGALGLIGSVTAMYAGTLLAHAG
jgi:putative copper export protein